MIPINHHLCGVFIISSEKQQLSCFHVLLISSHNVCPLVCPVIHGISMNA